MKYKHFTQSRIVKRTLVIIPSAALLVGFAFAQSASPPQPSPRPAPPSAQTTPATAQTAASPTPQSVASPQPSKKETHPGKRDLSKYDKATPITLAKNASKQDKETAVAQLRGFIFEHWQGKHHGYAQMSFPNPEGSHVAYFGEDERWIRQRERVAYFLRAGISCLRCLLTLRQVGSALA